MSHLKARPWKSLTDRHLEEPLRSEVSNTVMKMLETFPHVVEENMEEGASKSSNNRVISKISSPLLLGKKIGEGGFCTVYEVEGNSSLVCKVLSDETIQDESRIFIAAVDLVREGYWLRHFQQTDAPSTIVNLHGMSTLNEDTDMAQYYLLLEKHSTLLTHKIDEWDLATVENEQIYDRLVVALSLVKTFQYLHSHNIVYRDLKADNVGWDARRKQIILFDFGLAREIIIATAAAAAATDQKVTGSEKTNDNKYQMSGHTGSWAYMAPEVAKGYHYGLRVDVYSFGILLWELLSGSRAFGGGNSQPIHPDARPPFLRCWPESLERLITACWHWNPNHRPTFDDIETRLTLILEEVRPNKDGLLGLGQFIIWMKNEMKNLIR
jgi:serine/threonine protein kinase